jgi:hypothetical protein
MEGNFITKLRNISSKAYSHKGKIILLIAFIFISKKSYELYKLMRPYYDMYKELKGTGAASGNLGRQASD